jgi:Pectate lyase superfamily protein
MENILKYLGFGNHNPRRRSYLSVASTWLLFGTSTTESQESRNTAESVDIKSFGAAGDGMVDETASIQAALDSNVEIIVFPAGRYRHRPLVLSKPRIVIFMPGSVVLPIFDHDSAEKLYHISSSDITLDGLTIEGAEYIVGENKYLVYVHAASRINILNSHFRGVTASDGHRGLRNIKVTHGIYINGGADILIANSDIDNISGSAVFVRDAINLRILNNKIKNTGWYSINLDSGCKKYLISGNAIDGAGMAARYWGGSINLMSQTGGQKLKEGRIIGNRISGVHNYGSCIRAQSVDNCEISGNFIGDVNSGSLLPGPIAYISIDRRGTKIGAPENGRCTNILIENNTLVAGVGAQHGIYVKNQYKAGRDPHENIRIYRNTMKSVSAESFFSMGISIHGHRAGVRSIEIAENQIEVNGIAGVPLPGGIGVASVDASGEIEDLNIIKNIIVQGRALLIPAQIGIFLQPSITRVSIKGNTIDGFYHGIRIEPNAITLGDIGEQDYKRCHINFSL